MVTSLSAANNILYRAQKEGVSMTPMKLQKMLYLLYARYLYESGDPLFSGRFEVWKYGPVEPLVYDHFKNFGAAPIDEYANADNEGFLMINEDKSPLFKRCLDTVWRLYGNEMAWQLVNLTHQEGTAWHKADQRDERFMEDNEIKEDGRVLFEQ